MKGNTLLLCHGNSHYKIKELSPERTITVDADKNSNPDIVLDLFNNTRVKEGCNLFDRVVIMFCPINKDNPSTEFVLSEFIIPALKPYGILYTPVYKSIDLDMMERLGFYQIKVKPLTSRKAVDNYSLKGMIMFVLRKCGSKDPS